MAIELAPARDDARRRAIVGVARPHLGRLTRERAALAGVLLLAAVLNLWGLAGEGFANLFYAAAVRSALDSPRNLFFSAFDPGGYAATDKPPLGFAVQALFAKLFGFSGFVLALPQALAGIGAVLLLYLVVRRAFGGGAGLIAALALATTPIAVATARNNTIDSQLAVVSLLAVWATQRAIAGARLRWLLLAGALIGIGFLIKFAEALLIVPACAVAYLCCAPERLRLRLLKLLLAGTALAAIGGSWIVAVDAVPRSARPYIHSSSDDSELSVVLGENGLGRLLPGLLSGKRGPVATPPADAATVDFPAMSAGGTSNEVGPPGPLRLFGRPLAGQVAWLLPLALIGLGVAGWDVLRGRGDDGSFSGDDGRRATVLLIGGWLLTAAAFFSVAGFVHRYYLSMLAPAVAGAAAIGLAALWRRFRDGRRGWGATALPLALLLSAELAALIALPYPAFRPLLALVALGSGLPALLLVLWRYPTKRRSSTPAARTQALLAALAVGLLFAGPLLWSLAPIVHGDAAELPLAGPDLALLSRSAMTPDSYPRDADPALIAFLRAQHGGERYWLGAFSSVTAAPVVLALNRPVLTLGGYLGGDATTDAATLQRRVRDGEIRFLLLPAIDGIRAQRGEGVPLGVAQAVDWVRSSCAPEPDPAWRNRPDPPADPRIDPYFTLISGGSLYDCAGAAR